MILDVQFITRATQVEVYCPWSKSAMIRDCYGTEDSQSLTPRFTRSVVTQLIAPHPATTNGR